MSLLEVRNLCVDFETTSGRFRAVDGFDLTLNPGDITAIVGESGSGKSVAFLAMMGLLPWTATITSDVMKFDGHDLNVITPKQRRQIIGSSLNCESHPRPVASPRSPRRAWASAS